MLLKSTFVIVTHMMLALCTAVTLRRPFSLARLKAYSAILRELLRVIILRLSTTPETLWGKKRKMENWWKTNTVNLLIQVSMLFCLTSCSRLLYSPSVFSLMIMMSMFLWRVWTPGSDWQCITLANKSKLVLECKCKAETMAHVTTKTKLRLCKNQF